MSRVVLGIFIVVIITAVFLGVTWALNNFGIVDVKPAVFGLAGSYTGAADLAENYELGRKESKVLSKREAELRSLSDKLNDDRSKLDEERSAFEADKLQWQKEHLTTPEQPVASKPGQPSKVAPSATPDPKVQQYLTQVGSMKPDKAAEVIRKLPDEIVFQIFANLSSSKVTKIMENLPADYVAGLTRRRTQATGTP